MKDKLRLFSAILALVLAAGTVSCGNGGDDSDSTTSDNQPTTDTSSDTEASDGYVKPDKTFSGETVNFLIWGEYPEFTTEESTGDIINDAIYERNLKVQDMFGLNFSYDVRPGAGSGYSEWINTLNSSILANDNAYQIAGGYGYMLTSDTLNDSFQNLQANPYIDFSKPWWPANIIDAAAIGSRMNVCFGNVDPRYYDTTYAMLFNKKIAEETGAGDLYAVVNDGKWTLDKMFSLAISGARDLDGDTKIGEGDIYGYVTDRWMCYDAFIQSCDIKVTERDNDGLPKLVGLSERYIDAEKKISDFIYNSGAVKVSDGGSNDMTPFANGNAFFFPTAFDCTRQLRDMSDDFGILPYPKYDEAQKEYITYNAIGNSTTFVAPVTADETLVGCVLEALAYYGWKDIQPVYYERALKGKTTRDNDSEAMLDIIFGNIQFDFTQIYSYNFSSQSATSPSGLMRIAVGDKKDISSLWAKNEELDKSIMDSLIEALK